MREKKALFHFVLIVLAFVVFCFYSVACLYLTTRTYFCTEDVVSIEGFLVFDSSYSSNSNHLMTVFVQKAKNSFENVVSSRGIISVVSQSKSTVTSQEKIRAYGKVVDGLFICDSFEVIQKGYLCHIRQFLIQVLEKKLIGKDYSEFNVLSSALILGRAEDSQLSVKELAKNCGCLHVLALSGMHLNVLKKFCIRLFGKKKLGRIMSTIVVTLFVFVAGPRPSLIRSLLMFYLSFLPLDERLCCAFLLQVVLFPLTVINIGTLFGYSAMFAIVFLSPYLTEALKNVVPSFIGKILGPTLSAILFTSPVCLFNEGVWYPVSIIASPLCSVLIGFSMAEGFGSLLFGSFSFYKRITNYSYKALVFVLKFFSRANPSGWFWYCVYVAFVLLLFVFSFVKRRYISSHLLSSYQVI